MRSIKVTWLTADGERITADVPLGYTLMEAARANDIPGVVGECGGALSCATCHVVVEHCAILMGEPGPVEDDILDLAEPGRTVGSRLSCQITAHPDLDGIVLRVPG